MKLDVTGCLKSRVGSGGVAPASLRADLECWATLHEKVREERQEGRHAYLDLERAQGDAEVAVAFAVNARERFSRFWQCGIGGSTMGNIAIHDALPGDRRVCVVDNVDPRRLRDLDPATCRESLFHVVTKSGETAETLAQFLVIQDRLRGVLGDKWREHVCVTTDAERGTLGGLCRAEGVTTFAVPSGVGGRFSVLSPVGFVSAAFAGLDPRRIVAGALTARARNLAPDSPALVLACLLKRFYDQGRRQAVFWPYADCLRGVSDWWRQLLAESLGKRTETGGTGPMPIAALGATDQHSVHQLFMEGPDDKWFTLVEVADLGRDVEIPGGRPEPAFSYLGGVTLGGLLRAERRGTTHALLEAGRPVALLRLEKITEESVGALFLTLMLAVTYAGPVFGVDPYDQPGVEAGKRATFALLGREGYTGGAAIEAAIAPDPAWVF